MSDHRMSIYVVGATGYIGKAIFNNVNMIGALYGTSSSGASNLLPLQLNDPDAFDYKIINRGDTVLLAAAISAPDICASEYAKAWAVNVTGTSCFIQNVIDRGGRVIFFSSDTVYGESERELHENAKCNPAGEYAEMKFEVEERFSVNPSFKAIRLSYVFSREDKFTCYLTRCAERNEVADLFHPFYRAIVHLDDIVEGVLALTRRWEEIPEQLINFGGPEVVSRIDFAEYLRAAYLHNLRFKVTEPAAEFFKNRPRVIAMTSPVFARLLGRPPRTLREAAKLEFPSLLKTERVS